MNRPAKMKDRRLIEALDYIDDEYIASAALYKMRAYAESARPPAQTAGQSIRKYWRQFAALAACLILLAFASPVFIKVAEVISSFAAGWGSTSTIESSDALNTQETDADESDQYSISQDELDEINSAYAEKYGSGLLVARNCEDVSYWHPCLGMVCLYEKRDGLIIFWKHSIESIYNKYEVAGYFFEFPDGSQLLIYKDHKLYSVYSAYQNGILTEEEVGKISEAHYQHFYGEDRFG